MSWFYKLLFLLFAIGCYYLYIYCRIRAIIKRGTSLTVEEYFLIFPKACRKCGSRLRAIEAIQRSRYIGDSSYGGSVYWREVSSNKCASCEDLREPFTGEVKIYEPPTGYETSSSYPKLVREADKGRYITTKEAESLPQSVIIKK